MGDHLTLCGHALASLLLFFVFADVVSAEFHLTHIRNTSVLCYGNATLTPDMEGLPQAACLTPFVSSNFTAPIAGTCFYKDPVLLPSLSFSTMFSFNTLKFPTFKSGNGFTFYLSPSRPDGSGAPGDYLGWLNSVTNNDPNGHNFAVEFDLVNDTLGAPSDSTTDEHVGIDVNSLNSTITYALKDTTLTSLSSAQQLYVWINYDGVSKWIDVRLSQENKKPCKPIISQGLDLSNVLQGTMYAGFSASTGGPEGYNSQTTVFDWSFNTDGQAQDIYDGNEKCGLQLSLSEVLGIIIGILGLAIIGMLGLIVFFFFRTKKVSDLEAEKALLVAELKQLDFGAREFTYLDISEATRGFKDEIGKGGFGIVYKGNLSFVSSHKRGFGTDMVAVKHIRTTSDSVEDAKQLVAEVKVIGRLRHVNIVPVIGWCYELGQMFLVYKYMENGDLDEHLFPGDYPIKVVKDEKMFTWETRMNVLRGVAAALKFLHEDFESEQTILHRDIKTRNIMIDGKFSARLGDFGLARFCDRINSGHQSQQLIGTQGYMAPEYLDSGASVGTDVFSFGVMTLVVATGRKPIDKSLPGYQLLDWVRQLYDEGRTKDAVDFKLMNKDSTFNIHEMERVLRVGLFCCLYEPQFRPLMRDVVNALENAREGTSPIFSWIMPQQGYASSHESPFGSDDDTILFDKYKEDSQPFYSTKQSSFSNLDVD